MTSRALKLEHDPAPLSWLEQANKEIAELQEAAKADPKTFTAIVSAAWARAWRG